MLTAQIQGPAGLAGGNANVQRLQRAINLVVDATGTRDLNKVPINGLVDDATMSATIWLAFEGQKHRLPSSVKGKLDVGCALLPALTLGQYRCSMLVGSNNVGALRRNWKDAYDGLAAAIRVGAPVIAGWLEGIAQEARRDDPRYMPVPGPDDSRYRQLPGQPPPGTGPVPSPEDVYPQGSIQAWDPKLGKWRIAVPAGSLSELGAPPAYTEVAQTATQAAGVQVLKLTDWLVSTGQQPWYRTPLGIGGIVVGSLAVVAGGWALIRRRR